VENWHDERKQDGRLCSIFSLAPRKLEIEYALGEYAGTVDLHVISKKKHGTPPISLSVEGYRTITDPNPFIRSPEPRLFRVAIHPDVWIVRLPRFWGDPTTLAWSFLKRVIRMKQLRIQGSIVIIIF